MESLFKAAVTRWLALLLAASVAYAQDRVPFRQEELDQMLAPVALHPDPLLSQILLASTHPLEVVRASRWSRANPGLKGQDAVRAVEPMDWDPSVKSLTAFPQVLAMMGENIAWTERLGEAFLAQQADVMDTIQQLRRRAEAAGNLHSGEQVRVARQGEVIYIEPPAPEIVYVPYYDPVVVYGPWWWPAHPPVYWAPPRAYYVVPAHRPALRWGSGVVVSTGFFHARPDWHRRRVAAVHNPVTVNRATAVHRPDVRQRIEPPRIAEARRNTERRAAVRVERRDAPARRVDFNQRRREEHRVIPHPGTRSVDTRPAVAARVARPAVPSQVSRTNTRPAQHNVAGASAARSRPAARTENPAPRVGSTHARSDRGVRVRRD